MCETLQDSISNLLVGKSVQEFLNLVHEVNEPGRSVLYKSVYCSGCYVRSRGAGTSVAQR